MCVQISGVMGLTTAYTSYRNTHAHKYRLLVIGSPDDDVIGISCISLVLIGLFNMSIGVVKTARKCTLSTNQVVTPIITVAFKAYCLYSHHNNC